MKRENQYRQAWIDGWIRSRPDGVLHATVPATPVEGPRSGPAPYADAHEIKICLECPLDRCVLDTQKHCRRLNILRQEAKRKEKENGKDS